MSEPLFVDTSAWFALVNRSDPEHRATRAVLEQCPGRLVTSNFVFDEIVTLCLYRLGRPVALRVGDLLRGETVDFVRATAADETAAWELFHKRVDKQYSFTDCVSFVLMNRLGIKKVAALDTDFRREGFEVVPAPGE